ncbi:MAG: T9SS type A sorting domain-containing protein [Bacteroidetes bacterium]|nr:T9SS type A sorting domain-containing protein [Bacteroidota bacterium]
MKKIYYAITAGLLAISGVCFAQSQTFTFTGAIQTFTVPTCVSQVTITASGASGSNGYASGSPGGTGGNGAVVEGTFPVNGGDILHIFVGGQGTPTAGGFNGGGISLADSSAGGGGASDVRLNGIGLSNRIIVAGGGGAGGNGGCFGATVAGGNGGPGGGNGIAGANSTAGGGGFPGVDTLGGTFGVGCPPFQGSAGLNGSGGVGGAGGLGTMLCTSAPTSGGSGGGGFIGGGGGGAGAAGTVQCQFNDTGAGAGGAGGDCYTSPLMTATTTIVGGAAAGNGQVIISYTIDVIDTGINQLAANQLSADQSGATYEWINCTTDLAVAGETSQTFIATQDGSYKCVVTIGAGCTDTTACVNLFFAGLNELSSDLISVYPNPTKGIFSVELSNVEATNIHVFNALGQEVYTAKCSGKVVSVDLKDKEPGVYTIQVETNQGIATQRVIKQ